MKLQNLDEKTLGEASRSSGVFSFNQKSSKGLKEEESNKGLPNLGGDNTMRKIEVSGDNLSLIVDLNCSLTSLSSKNVLESNRNLEKEFHVGDLVWVMSKHQKKWWPGEVIGFKGDSKKSFLVSYIGQGNVVYWYLPSKLKHFKENFENMMKHRTDKWFFAMVEKAMILLSNSLKLEMTCPCIAEENQLVTEQKTKILIPNGLSLDQFEPKEFVCQLKNLAKTVSSSGILEITVLQSRLSVFHSFSGHKQIPMSQLRGNKGKHSITAVNLTHGEFIGSPSTVKGTSRKKFAKEWYRKFISETENLSVRDDLRTMALSELMSELNLLAVDYKSSEEIKNIRLVEWFFSKFRISKFHDEDVYKMQMMNLAGLKDKKLAKDAGPGTEQKTSKSKKSKKPRIEQNTSELTQSEKLKIEPLCGIVSDGDINQKIYEFKRENSKIEPQNNGVRTLYDELKVPSKPLISKKPRTKRIVDNSGWIDSATNELLTKDFSEKLSLQSPDRKTSQADTLSRSATLVPDLNSKVNALNSAEFNHIVSTKDERTKSMMLNFQVMSPCSINRSGMEIFPALDKNFTKTDLVTNGVNLEKKKRGRKRKNAEKDPVTLPDLNGVTTETNPEANQRRKYRKKEDSVNGITILFMKFSSPMSIPSRDDLTSTFSAFGPLDASETHLLEEFNGAQVAFVSSGDAIDAVKSLEKSKPFGESLISYRLQQKLISIQRKIAPRMPVISQVSPVMKLNKIPTSVDSMRQNLMMMTTMLEKSGDSLSKEIKEKLKSEISGLLEKVSSMPSSSSS